MRRMIILVLMVGTANPQAGGAQAPKSPAESLACIRVRPGFTVELMVAEPLVTSPIAFAWGADGKLWVVEMGDYPLGVDGKGKPGGRIKFLEKTRENGPYDRATVFLDGLGFPTGVTPWGKGVLVTCAPDIFYAEDTDGDGKADKKQVLFTGFGEGNQQHRVNGLVWGLDNWLYGANGDSGGKIKSIKTGKVVDIRGRDFRLKPDTGAFEAVTGQTQFGRARDDWGNWFGNNNSNPMYHFVLDDHYLRRNPFLLPPDPRVQMSVSPGPSAVYPISKPQPRFNNPQSVNHFTSACSAIVYRDNLFGPAFAGNSFVSEPVHNLIHREVMTSKGVTFTSRRADDEQKSEFLASSDNWFRPTTIATGPDGALWVADMYRFVIEHPEWIPKDWQKKLDLRAGHDKGRIYRVYPKGKTPRPIPRLDALDVKELVEQLGSPNGWARDTAHRLLLGLGETKKQRLERRACLQQALTSETVLARLHALRVLDGLNLLTLHELQNALQDTHPAVRKHALRCLEPLHTATITDPRPDGFVERLAASVTDCEPQVRMELAYVLGAWASPPTARILVDLLNRDAGDVYIQTAGLSSINQETAPAVLTAILEQPRASPKMMAHVLKYAQRLGMPDDLARLLARFAANARQRSTADWFEANAEILKVLAVRDLAGPKKESDETLEQLKEAHAAARRSVADGQAPLRERAAAVFLLGRGIGDDREDRKLIAALLTPQTPDALQLAALQSLSVGGDAFAGRVMLGRWKGYSPSVRGQALDILLSRPAWALQLAEALEKKQVPPAEIDAPRRQRLLAHADAEVRGIAAKVFAGSSSPDRGKIVDEYLLTVPDKARPDRGTALFAKHCAACHKLGAVGQAVGPDLASVGDKSRLGLIIAILDPNRAVEARYVNYLAITKDGRTLSGIIAGETGTSVTLVGADGKAHNLLRGEIEELSSTGKSLMPEGLEKELPPQAMADLIAFIGSQAAVPRRKEFPGNVPTTVRPAADGALRLTAKTAAIYGPTLVLEKQYGNLGMWSSAEDHATWTIALPKQAKFVVWIDYACDDSAAGNAFTIGGAGRQIGGRVGGTGSWDVYRHVQIGTLTLPAGTHELTFRAEGPLRGALIDLKEIQLVPAK